MQGAYSYIANMYLMCILFRPADVPTQKKPKAEEKLSLAQAAIIAGHRGAIPFEDRWLSEPIQKCSPFPISFSFPKVGLDRPNEASPFTF